MADHTPSTASVLRPALTHHGSTPMYAYPESSGSTFGYGDLVQLNTATNTHRIVEASSLSTAYVGVAMEPASSVRDTKIPVAVANADARFYGWAKETLLSTMVGQFRSFARDTSLAIDYVAANSTTGDGRVQVTRVGVDELAGGPYAVGDSNGYVEFRFLPPFTAFGQSTTSS